MQKWEKMAGGQTQATLTPFNRLNRDIEGPFCFSAFRETRNFCVKYQYYIDMVVGKVVKLNLSIKDTVA